MLVVKRSNNDKRRSLGVAMRRFKNLMDDGTKVFNRQKKIQQNTKTFNRGKDKAMNNHQ